MSEKVPEAFVEAYRNGCDDADCCSMEEVLGVFRNGVPGRIWRAAVEAAAKVAESLIDHEADALDDEAAAENWSYQKAAAAIRAAGRKGE